MSEDIVEVIKNKMDILSDTINHQFDTSFLFEYLFPDNQELNQNKDEITMEIFPNDSRTAEMNYIALMKPRKHQYDDLNKKEEPFTNIGSNDIINIPNDTLSHIYFASLGALGIYILYGLMKKTKLLPI